MDNFLPSLLPNTLNSTKTYFVELLYIIDGAYINKTLKFTKCL